jgi:hypothetical protein
MAVVVAATAVLKRPHVEVLDITPRLIVGRAGHLAEFGQLAISASQSCTICSASYSRE